MAFSITRFIKGLRLSVSGTTNPANLDLTPAGTSGTTTTVQSSQTADRTLTLPDATDTLVGKATTDTLSNKTLDNSSVITVQDTNLTIQDNADNTKQVKLNASGITTGTTRTLDVPDEDTTLVGTGATQSISNKSLNNTNSIVVKDVNLTIQDDVDVTKAAKFQASTITTGTTRNLSLPDADTTLVGTNATQSLSNKTIDNSNTVTLQDSNLTIQDNADATKQLKFEASGITTGTTRTLTAPDANTTIAGTDATQTLTNKTISGASNTISNISLTSSVTGTLPIANGGTNATTTTAAFNNLAPTTTKADLITRDASDNVRLAVGTDGQVLVADSAQTTGLKWAQISGVKNYITNDGAESSVDGWSGYQDAAQATPVDGTGSPNANFAVARITSGVLRGVGSFQITKAGSNTQGMGISYPFTIDVADKAKPLSISFDYQIASGTYSGGTSSTDSDFTVYIYDVTNSRLIQPSGYKLDGAVVGTNYSFKGSFQASSDSVSYRLIIHSATASTQAITFTFDNVVVGPIVTTTGAAMTDEQSWTPTITGLGTPTINYAKWSRFGDKFYGDLRITAGTPTAVAASISLPNGIIPDPSSGSRYAGEYKRGTTNEFSAGAMLVDTNNGNVIYFANHASMSTGGGNPTSTVTGSNLVGAGDVLIVRIIFKVLGWSSNSVVSSDTDTRVVAARANTSTSSTTSGAGAADIVYTSKSYDTHGVYNTSTGVYTVAVPGKYEIKAAIGTNAATAGSAERQLQLYIVKNGSIVSYKQSYSNSTASRQVFTDIVDTIDLVAGDTIKLQWTHNWGVTLTCSGSSTENFFSIDRISGPSQIAASESVSALYNGTPTGTLNSSFNKATLPTKVKDTHGTYSSGTYTIPVSGTYSISAQLSIDATYAAGNRSWVGISAGGVVYQGDQVAYGAAGSLMPSVSVHSIPLLAGATIEIHSASTGTTPTFTASSTKHWFSIVRTGNY